MTGTDHDHAGDGDGTENGHERGSGREGHGHKSPGRTSARTLAVVSAVVVEFTGVRAVDPAVAVLIAAVVLWSAGKVLRGSGEIFLGRSPVATGEVRATLSSLSGVEHVEDVHIWAICSESGSRPST